MNLEPGNPFILGVNYWPRRKAMYWWSDFDAGEVREEFTIIRDLGLRLVRIFLLWDDWQPTPDTVSPTALADLETVADIAADLGLKLDITFFTGHMSGPSWVPRWMLRSDKPMPPRIKQVVSGGQIVNCGYANYFADPVCLAAERLLLKRVVGRLKDHPGVGMWNLGNEPDLFAWPPDAATGRAWVREMTTLIRTIDPNHPVTCGLHAESIIDDNGLRLHDVFAEVDVAVMHGYPMYVAGLENPLDPDYVPYICALTSAFCGKPTLMEEFGGCTTGPGMPSMTWMWTAYGEPRTQFMASEEALADYMSAVLPRLVDVGSPGAVTWCFADYVSELWPRPPCDEVIHERFFGLVRPDGRLKPHALAMQRFAATNPIIQPAKHTVTLDIKPEEYYRDAAAHSRRLYREYLKHIHP